jgi:hypothetical protein
MKREARQSLTLLVSVTDADACAAALAQGRSACETAFAENPRVHTASLALLPPLAGTSALLFECVFDGSLRDCLGALFLGCAPELNQIFRHCAGFPDSVDAGAFAELVSARASRAVACPDSESTRGDADPLQRLRAAWSARWYWPSEHAERDPSELERRRAAVGMQDWQPGVPLLHVARVPTRARARLRAALRALALDTTPIEHGARFLVQGERLVFLAYPGQPALLWSERVAGSALRSLSRVWAQVPEFAGRPWQRRRRRVRNLQQFLLDGRVPVAVWFNARAEPHAL